jgi:hypothetical protein
MLKADERDHEIKISYKTDGGGFCENTLKEVSFKLKAMRRVCSC